MKSNLNINSNDNEEFEGCLDKLIPIVAAIIVTIIIYLTKK